MNKTIYSNSDMVLAWMYLARVAEGPCLELDSLIRDVGPLDAAERVKAGKVSASLRARIDSRRLDDISHHDMEIAQRHGIRLVTPDDEEWPAWSFVGCDTDAMRARRSKDRHACAPYVLWVKGICNLAELSSRGVSIVGSRCPSDYARYATSKLADGIAAQEIPIISGAALGTDTLAHQSAVAAGTPTVAVLACGLDVAYPSANQELLTEIAKLGCVVSEYAPGTRPGRHRFLVRNRIIAALGGGTLVTSAGWRSGALNTASWAQAMGRPVMALPGPITNVDSLGCHRLIRDFAAELVTRAEEIIELISPVGAVVSNPAVTYSEVDGLTDEESVVYGVLPQRGSITLKELTIETTLSFNEVSRIVQKLIAKGAILESSQGWTRIPRWNLRAENPVCSRSGRSHSTQSQLAQSASKGSHSNQRRKGSDRHLAAAESEHKNDEQLSLAIVETRQHNHRR